MNFYTLSENFKEPLECDFRSIAFIQRVIKSITELNKLLPAHPVLISIKIMTRVHGT